eukprot:SAG11_NODE_21794_length_418_cov_2.009404_1_plen_77_part_10
MIPLPRQAAAVCSHHRSSEHISGRAVGSYGKFWAFSIANFKNSSLYRYSNVQVWVNFEFSMDLNLLVLNLVFLFGQI